MTVTSTHPLPRKALLELGRIDGVLRTEPVRVVLAILRNGNGAAIAAPSRGGQRTRRSTGSSTRASGP